MSFSSRFSQNLTQYERMLQEINRPHPQFRLVYPRHMLSSIRKVTGFSNFIVQPNAVAPTPEERFNITRYTFYTTPVTPRFQAKHTNCGDLRFKKIVIAKILRFSSVNFLAALSFCKYCSELSGKFLQEWRPLDALHRSNRFSRQKKLTAFTAKQAIFSLSPRPGLPGLDISYFKKIIERPFIRACFCIVRVKAKNDQARSYKIR